MAKDIKLSPGQVFGNWTLQGDTQIGRGGNGVVWEAIDSTGRRGAIKFLHKSHVEEASAKLARFRDEIRFLRAEGNRTGILPLLDANDPESPTVADRPWFVTPYATPLGQIELAGVAKLIELVRMIETISRTLQGLHAEGKFHRDLKPDNLLVLDGTARVGDFGLVDFPEKQSVTVDTEIMGPLFYVAPEMMGNAANVVAAPADVYALAKTLWVLSSGQRYPLPGEQHADVPALRLSTYCPHARAAILDRLIERATRHDATARPTMEQFANELAAWLTGPSQATGTSLDLESLSREYSAAFDLSNRNAQRRSALLEEAGGILAQFHGTLEWIATATAGTTQISPSEVQGAVDPPPCYRWIEAFGQPTVQWLRAWEVETAVVGEMHRIRLTSLVQVELLSDQRIRVVAAHVIRHEIGRNRQLFDTKRAWDREAIAPGGSAELENGIQDLSNGLRENLPAGIAAFGEALRVTQN